MRTVDASYDVITYGRSSIDLYSNDIGAPFVDIKEFGAYCGGSPLNIAVGARRLGLRSALLTAVGEDQVGEFILSFLDREGVETAFIPKVGGARTSAVLLGIEPPDHFPLVFYRENCADMELTIDHVLAAPVERCRLFEMSGTALSREPSRSAAFFAAERARDAGVPVLVDIDFRADQWHDPRAFGVTMRSFLRLSNIAIGTEEEILAAELDDPEQITITDEQISAPEIVGDAADAIRRLMGLGLEALVVKRGAHGASVFLADGSVIEAPGFPVEVVNVLGAGDAFAAGFIYGYLHGWEWRKALRMGNACGAILVTRPGCSNFTPYEGEAMEFIEGKGGF